MSHTYLAPIDATTHAPVPAVAAAAGVPTPATDAPVVPLPLELLCRVIALWTYVCGLALGAAVGWFLAPVFASGGPVPTGLRVLCAAAFALAGLLSSRT